MSAILQVFFNDAEGTAKFLLLDPETAKPYDLTLKVTRDQYYRWNRGEVIQKVMPHLSLDEREALITGVRPGRWKDYLGPEETEA